MKLELELELAGTSSSVIQTYSSSSSNSFPAFAPKMADGKGRDDTKLWPAAKEKQLILILLLEESKGNIPNGRMNRNCLSVVVEEFNKLHTKNPYTHQQIKEKFKRLKKRHNAFSELIGTPGIEFDRPTNTVRGPKSAWLEVETRNRKCKEFQNRVLDHFDLLEQLFKTAIASSAQPDSPDDVDEISHPDMGQGSNRKGKLPVRSNTSTGEKRKTIEAIIEMESWKKMRSEDKTIESPDYSVSKATEIVNSMFGGPVSNSILLKFLPKLGDPIAREMFITLHEDMRPDFILNSCGSG